MAPTKTPKASTSQAGTSSSATPSKRKYKSKQPDGKVYKAKQDPDGNAVPGVQKIKASIRQTRRLLAKDKLAADVRTKTERRLKALEKDLAEAERVRKERMLATKYRKVKFFEKQKVTRKILKVKKQLEESEDPKEQKKLQKELNHFRRDLNYILHYPKLEKYVSLFPPEVRNQAEEKADTEDAPSPQPAGDSKYSPDVQREKIRQWVKKQMKRGLLSAEPEVEGAGSFKAKGDPYSESSLPTLEEEADAHLSTKEQNHPAKSASLGQDDFFDNDEDGEDDEDDDVEGNDE